ncbi:hypothetical protein, partial [uncultured Roseobacter sp.]|uniref:hypothetical protein n=1 Tax=uncultured Roseobacter sp. TaxID=114847 RepID=UPI0026086C2A
MLQSDVQSAVSTRLALRFSKGCKKSRGHPVGLSALEGTCTHLMNVSQKLMRNASQYHPVKLFDLIFLNAEVFKGLR